VRDICTPLSTPLWIESPLTSLPLAEFPEQGDLIKARDNEDAEDDIAALKIGLRSVARQILNRVFDGEGVNVIVAPADSSLCIHAAASGAKASLHFPHSFSPTNDTSFRPGYPIATVPLGQLKYNGRPFGLCMVAQENREDTLLQFMAAYESASPPRAVPR
jgi:amidase